jgi:hypothetical protein
LLSAQLHSFTLFSWGAILFVTVGVAVEEYLLWRKLTSHIAAASFAVTSGSNDHGRACLFWLVCGDRDAGLLCS